MKSRLRRNNCDCVKVAPKQKKINMNMLIKIAPEFIQLISIGLF